MTDLHAEVQSASFWSQESNAHVQAKREQMRCAFAHLISPWYENPAVPGRAGHSCNEGWSRVERQERNSPVLVPPSDEVANRKRLQRLDRQESNAGHA